MKLPLLICGLPRSRTFWLYKYFSEYENLNSNHEHTLKVNSVSDFCLEFYDPSKQFINVDAFNFLTYDHGLFEKATVIYIEKDLERCIQSTLDIFPEDSFVHTKYNYEGLYESYSGLRDFYRNHVNLVIDYYDLDNNIEYLHSFLEVEYDPDIHKKMKEMVLNTSTAYFSKRTVSVWDPELKFFQGDSYIND